MSNPRFLLSELRNPTTPIAQTARGILVSIGFLLGGLVCAGVVLNIATLGLLEVGVNAQSPSFTIFGGTALQAVAFGLVVFGYMKYFDQRELIGINIPTKADIRWILIGIAGLLALNFLGSVAFWWLDISVGTNLVEEIGRESPTVFLYLIPLAFLAIGPGEELLFRGAIQGRLEQATSTWTAITFSSVLFALTHYGAIVGTGIEIGAYIGLTFALSILLGYSYAQTDNIAVPSLIHGAYNALLFTGLYLHVTGSFSPLV